VYPLNFPDIRQRHLGRAIRMQAQHNGDATFILFDHTRYSYRETNQRVNALAAGLAGQGIRRGDRVAFFMSTAPEVIFLALAVNKLGAVWVPINAEYKGAWLEDTIRRSRAGLLVTDSVRAHLVADCRDMLDDLKIAVLGTDHDLPDAIPFDSLYVPDAPEPDLSAYDYGDTCAILWTSGTTGRSKAVMQSHNVWFNACEAVDKKYKTREGDIIYCMMPLFNSGAWVMCVFRALLTGIPLAIDPAFSVSTFWERINFYRATQTYTLGTMHMFLWNVPEKPDDARNTLERMGATPMPPDIREPFARRFGVELIGTGLGQSEALQILSQTEDNKPWPPGSCGTPTKDVEVRLVTDGGGEAGVDEPGECWIRPRGEFLIFNGYFDDEEATRNAFEGDWFKTGDLLRRDSAGNYYFVDRKKDSVRYGGRNISTFEVEIVARSHPAVADCAAFGIPCAELESESELKLNCVLAPDQALEAEALARYINENAPYFFVPRYIEFVEELPYTPTNKVQKHKLREAGLSDNTWDAKAAGFEVQR
jgi:crotonobetaine/carnitine-CoA ligase